jgi:membrane-associated phospholipid phosphatase
MWNIIKANKWFFIPYLVFLLVAGIGLILQEDKGAFLLLLNHNHLPTLDKIFGLTNNFGEALFYVVILVSLLLYRLRYSILGALILLQIGIVIQFLKMVVFHDVVRPMLYFQAKGIPLYFVDGVTINRYYSFPSGHTATAFAMLCFISLVVQDKRWGLFFFFAAVVGGLARIYLAQHFLVDVFFGSLIGVSISTLNYFYISPRNWYDKHPAFYGPLHKAFRKK